MSRLIVSDALKDAHPSAVVGLLVMNDVTNPGSHPTLDARKDEIERELRERFAGVDVATIRAADPFAAYVAYYKRFKKTYHVAQQLASIALGGKAIPRQAALVEAMFMAELRNGLLTAGHDVDALAFPLRLEAASGVERYELLNGTEQACKSDDIIMLDARGPICSVLLGPDTRTQLRSTTRRVLFMVYGVPGVTEMAVRRHLTEIEGHVRLIAPAASVREATSFAVASAP